MLVEGGGGGGGGEFVKRYKMHLQNLARLHNFDKNSCQGQGSK
jgi:hypothetical protein